MSAKWNFPNNGCGQVRGVSDAGIETFTGTEIQSLAREICQNSLDAAVEESATGVKVEFERYAIHENDIPGYIDYASNIKKANEYWATKKGKKTINYLEKAFNAINQNSSYVLRISDYNTTGLNDPYGDSDEGWNALTKLDGGATKSGDKAGAFGIGKNAFSGILEMEGKELNEFFREMETPAHDKWLPSRHSKNPSLAKEYYSELKDWVRDIIQNLGEHSSDKEIEVEGLAGVLQQESENASLTGDNKKESLHDTIGEILVQPRTAKPQTRGSFYGNEGEGKSKNTDFLGTIGKDSGFPTTRSLRGTRHRSNLESHRGVPLDSGRDMVHKKSGGDTNQSLKNVRIIKKSQKNYRVSFVLPRDILAGHIEIVAVGENGKANKLSISAANEVAYCIGIKRSTLGINFDSIIGNEKVVVEFSLLDIRDYAMEVMDNWDLKSLIGSGQAEYVIHIECSNTSYRTTIHSITELVEKDIPIGRISGKIEVVVLIVSKSDIKGLKIRD